MNQEINELTSTQRKDINNLNKDCANYDNQYCLSLDCKCVMQNKVYATCICKYFEKSVLPLDKELESVLLHKPIGYKKNCSVCGKAFNPKSNRAIYCSELCKSKGTRNKERIKKRNQRSKVV